MTASSAKSPEGPPFVFVLESPARTLTRDGMNADMCWQSVQPWRPHAARIPCSFRHQRSGGREASHVILAAGGVKLVL